MLEKQPVEIEFNQKTAVIRFVCPEARNPLSAEVLKILDREFDRLESLENIETIVFTGSDGVFAAGANLREVSALDARSADFFGRRGQNLMQKIYSSEKFTWALIDGFCMGGAIDLALSCRRRTASPRSVFAHPGARLGIITGWSGTQILPSLIGRKKALEIFLTAKKIDAREALEIGLIDEISENPYEEIFRADGKIFERT